MLKDYVIVVDVHVAVEVAAAVDASRAKGGTPDNIGCGAGDEDKAT